MYAMLPKNFSDWKVRLQYREMRGGSENPSEYIKSQQITQNPFDQHHRNISTSDRFFRIG
jgi:hypothetical protein